jgi:CrcB protein
MPAEAHPQPAHGPVDPDVDLHDPAQRAELSHHHPAVLGAIALGGVIGAESRYGLGQLMPHTAASWPWATLVINLTGSLLLGLLMGLLGRRARPHALLRPFFGVGILGGYTTFSTYALDAERLLQAGRDGVALGYLTATLVGGIAMVACGLLLTRPRTGGAA